MADKGRFVLDGPITFDNAASVAAEGESVLSRFFEESAEGHWDIDLGKLELADSSALSVFLSWMRLAHKNNVTICFSNIPCQLAALAQVCDVQELMQGASCELTQHS